jgi:surface polysaccharide O-acyltransferase-like enzyme
MMNTSAAHPPRNYSVDTFRLLAALAIVILHVTYQNVPKELTIGLRLLSRWAIPFFFIISGYFLAASNAKSERLNVQPAVERLIWVFLLWAFIYAFVVIYQYDLNTSIKRITSPYFIYFGNFVHLWFIPSLIFGYLMIAFCYNFNLKGLLIVLSILAVITALLSASYAIIHLGTSLDLTAASVWLSIPFLYIGFLLYQKGPPSWWISVLLILFGAGLQIFEARFLYNKFGSSPYDHEFLIGTIPFGIGMAGLALRDLKFLKYSVFSNWGRDYSLGIYLIHPLIAILLSIFTASFSPVLLNNPVWQLSFPLMVVSLSIVVLGLLHKYFPSGFNILLGKPLRSIK